MAGIFGSIGEYVILRTALTDWLLSRARKRRQANVPRPRLPTHAERVYVGAMVRYADTFEALVRAAVAQHWPDVFRTDGLQIGPLHLGRVRRQLGPVEVALNRAAETMVPLDRVGKMTADHVTREATRVIGLAASDVLPLGHTVDMWRTNNVALIKGMGSEMLGRVVDTLEAYDGARVEDIRDELAEAFDMTRARAALIARDQTLKLNAQLNEDVHASVGITEYYWSTSNDTHVRPAHDALNGTRQAYANPPVVDPRTGRTANPGGDFQCRCCAIPRLPELE